MGSCNFKADPTETTVSLSKNHFQFHFCIGKGGFGKVWKVEHKKDHSLFAMKEMLKARILSKKSVNSVLNERKLLLVLKHGFLVNIHYAFQDRDNLYLAMDLKQGGDLRFHLGRTRVFSETQTKFFVGCMLLALEYLHKNNIIHRDIKPENLVFDLSGYLHLTDLGIARTWVAENSKDTSGTPGYMAPEVMCRQNHNFVADYFAVGIIAYECMFGKRPYSGKSRKEIRDQILAKQVQIKREEVPELWSVEAADFINRRKPSHRLGAEGIQEIKQHPWIFDFPWDELEGKKIDPPFKPSQHDENFDVRLAFGNDPWKDANSEALHQGTLLLRDNETQGLFAEYFFDINEQATGQENTTNLVN